MTIKADRVAALLGGFAVDDRVRVVADHLAGLSFFQKDGVVVARVRADWPTWVLLDGENSAYGFNNDELELLEKGAQTTPQEKDPMTAKEYAALRLVDKAKWARLVHAAMVDAEGHIPQAAETLGVSVATMYRWLGDTCFVKLRTPRAPQGVTINRNGGRPKGT